MRCCRSLQRRPLAQRFIGTVADAVQKNNDSFFHQESNLFNTPEQIDTNIAEKPEACNMAIRLFM
jgi:hypothetical protein